MKARIKTFAIPAIFFAIGSIFTILISIVPGCDQIDVDNEGIEVPFELEAIPILPNGFPIYPKSLYSGQLADIGEEIEPYVEIIMDDLLGLAGLSSLIPDSTMDIIVEVFEWIFAQRHPFYDPGPLSTALNQQIAAIFKNTVVIDNVSLNLKIKNITDEFWPVPIRFSLYMGDADNVYSKFGQRSNALVETTESDSCGGDDKCTFLIQPGETKEITTDNLEGLVSALTELHSLAIDYDTELVLDEMEANEFGDLFNANLKKIYNWRLKVEGMSVNVSGKGKLEFNDVADWVKEWF